MRSALFVCLGNICRSPAAEAAVRQRLPDLGSDSAGTAGGHTGKPPYGPMQDAARARGLQHVRRVDGTLGAARAYCAA